MTRFGYAIKQIQKSVNGRIWVVSMWVFSGHFFLEVLYI